jgi:uncharacterized protein (TIGR00369 family)
MEEAALKKIETGASEHHHIITWDDPELSARAIKTMNGLDYLLALRDGRSPMPPMYRLFNFRFLDVEKGHVVLDLTPAEYQCNPAGMIHGGLACTVLDSATACAIHTTLPAQTELTTLEIKVNFVRGIKVETGNMRCEGRVIHAGSRTATADGRLTDSKGELYAHGVVTCLILRPSSGPLV